MINLTFFNDFKNIAFLVAFFALGFTIIYLYHILINKVPAKWLCDYNEKPTEELLGTRFVYDKKSIVLSIVTGLCFSYLYMTYGKSPILTIGFAIFIALLLPIAMCDAKYRIIPDQFTIAVAVVAIAFAIYDCFFGFKIFNENWYDPILGAVIGGGALIVIDIIGSLVFKKEAIGFGDIKLLAAIGFFAGKNNVTYILLITIFVAFFHFIYLLFFKKSSFDSYLPLGPYICIGTIIFILFYFQIIDATVWYFHLLGI